MRTITVAFALFLAGMAPGRAAEPFQEARFRAIVGVLSADAMLGRAAGTEGGARAADYLRGRFRELGLAPGAADGTFDQTFSLPDGRLARNLLAVLPGRGDLAAECVIVSAHYDHIGVRPDEALPNGDAICNGADDNASGIAALLLIAEDLTARRDALPASHRTVLFAAFDAEELGLLGSRHYVAHPARPLERTVAVVNFDMIGRLSRGKLYAGDAASSPPLAEALAGFERDLGVPIESRFGGVARSDQAPFLERRIPGVHFNTGLYPEYHKPSDEIDRVDCAGGARVARVGGRLVGVLLDRPGPLPFRRLDPAHDMQHAIRLVTTLGAIPNLRAQEGRHLKVLLVRPGSPAARCGIRAGDELASVNGRAIERVEDAVALVSTLRLDRDVHVGLLRAGRTIEATLGADAFAGLAGPKVTPRADGRYDASFSFEAPRGTRTVHLTGSFNDWRPDALRMEGPDASGRFRATVPLEAGHYEYKFVVDGGDARPDPENIHQTGPEGNSVVWAGRAPAAE